MSTQYPILDNRPINKWKVAELKEELKRRNLMTKGLKDDLVKRLDEAIRYERAAIETEEGKGFDGGSKAAGNFGDAIVESSSFQMENEALKHDDNKANKVGEVVTGMNIDDDPTKIDQGKALEQEATVGTDPITMVGKSAVIEAPSAKTNVQDEVISPHTTSNEGMLDSNKVSKGDEVFDLPHKDAVLLAGLGTSEAAVQSTGEAVDSQVASSKETLEEKSSKIHKNEVEGTDMLPEKAVENKEVKPENISLKSSHMDADCNEPYSGDQVYEVSPNLGFQVKSESFSTDILNVNENKELKDNLNADNVQLEPEIVRLEMLQASPSRDPPDDGIVHPSDDLMPHGNQTLYGETDDQPKNLKTSKKNDNADKFSVDVSVVEHNLESEATKKVECDNELNQISFAKDKSSVSGLSPEKIEPFAEDKFDAAASREERKSLELGDNHFTRTTDVADGELLAKVNFDHSSADDSMEEDMSETRHAASDHNSIKVGEKIDSDKEPGIGESITVDVMQHVIPSDKLESSKEHEDSVAALSEKRKFDDATEAGNEEPSKRLRRWNNESQEVPESQRSAASLSTRPKASPQTASTRLNLTESNSILGEEAPKECVVPPSQKTPTTSLRIDHFLRPFTLKAVQELLAKTGNVCSFWMDHIKTHCYVTYSSVEEAIETRNAVDNLQWPPNGGRLLVADFVDPEEVKLHVEAPSQSATPSVNTSTSAVKPPAQPAPPTRQQGPMKHEPPHPLSRQPPARDSSTTREELTGAPSPVAEKIDLPIITLDDLFRKTRTTPRIYYLPLTDEQVAAKRARQGRDRQ